MGVVTKLLSAVLFILCLLLGLFYMFVGAVKLTPALHADTFEEMKREFVKLAKVFPLADVLQMKVDPNVYRMSVGAVEFIAGFILAFIPGCIKTVANLVLLVVMGGATYSMYALKESKEKMMPAVVCGTLLLLCLIIRRIVCSCSTRCTTTVTTKTQQRHTKAE